MTIASLAKTHRFLGRTLEVPHYGYERNGKLYIPTQSELLTELKYRVNFFKDRKNWVSAWSFFSMLFLAVPFIIFVSFYFTLPLFLLSLFYSSVIMNIHGTAYLHRYVSHQAFRFRNSIWIFLFKNLTIKVIQEEIFAVSHYVHHAAPEAAGDPYNPLAGRLYCFLADVNHQSINKNMSEKDYLQVIKMVSHWGTPVNSYAEYQKWGSCFTPQRVIGGFLLNWLFWFAVFTLVGGISLALAFFSGAFFWSIAIRNFNYKTHGGGKKLHRDGIEFHREDLSMNLMPAGFLCGEWHNNHHAFPKSARAGFLSWQFDLSWYLIRSLYTLGIVTFYHDDKKAFMKKFINRVPLPESKKD